MEYKRYILEIDCIVWVGVAHSCTRFPCYLGMEINAKTQWTTTKIVELGN